MQGLLVVGLIAIGFVLGVLVTALFGHRLATIVAADAKAVAFESGRVITDAQNRIKATVTAMELRLHAKVDGLKADAGALGQDITKKL